MQRVIRFLPLVLLLPAAPARAQLPARLGEMLAAEAAASGAEIGVALLDLGSGDSLFQNAHWRVHAASTMKIPVLLELAHRVDAGDLTWTTRLAVRNRFRSVLDGSPYALSPSDDSDSTLYLREGDSVPVHELARLMIVRSSNFATNLLIDRLDPARINARARALGADSIEVRRGVEDQKAYDAGIINSTTARDLAILLRALAAGTSASPASTQVMLEILSAQEFRDGIPAGLPAGVRVANKTGTITGIHHDAAIVFPTGRSPYVLVILTRGFADEAAADRYIAQESREVWEALGGPAQGSPVR
jgi:beta-lactamase class A